MVESAMDFLRIAESENYYNIVLSMKSSNPIVMVEAYRLLVQNMYAELGHLYPLHLGVTEAGDGEDGRIKSAMGIGTLLEEGIGDTIRVSLTEDPEFELPVCKDIVRRYPVSSSPDISENNSGGISINGITVRDTRETLSIQTIGGKNVPVVIADLSTFQNIKPETLSNIGYHYNEAIDKWNISDAAADLIFCGTQEISFPLPGTLKLIYAYSTWLKMEDNLNSFPLLSREEYLDDSMKKSTIMNFVLINVDLLEEEQIFFQRIKNDPTAILFLRSDHPDSVQFMRMILEKIHHNGILNPVILICESDKNSMDETLIHYAIEMGALLMDGYGNGILLRDKKAQKNPSRYKTINSIAFGILQASRTRISKTEYISCPSCGRTLFDLQTTTAKIRSVTNHLKGVKIAIMGCIVNGPGEMADADFGYVGSGQGKITLYRGKEVIKRNVPAEIAVDELIQLLKENNVWIEPAMDLV
jgi:(E)-4-hydroxy-3-methylbut-2-enyl-diphosphate synthase